MTHKSELGQKGEDIACKYLATKGYKIIGRNIRKLWGELDIVAKAPDKTLVFIEVKTMSQNEGGLKPEDQLTQAKLAKLRKTSQLYAGHYPEKVDDKRGWRIDLLALTINGENCEIKQYENIG